MNTTKNKYISINFTKDRWITSWTLFVNAFTMLIVGKTTIYIEQSLDESQLK